MVLLLLTPSPTESFNIVPMETKPYHARPEYGVIFRPTADRFQPSDSYTSIFFNVKFPNIPTKPDLPTFIHNKCMQDSENQHIKPTSQQIEQHLFLEQESDQHFIQLLPVDAMTASTYVFTGAELPDFDWFPSAEDLTRMRQNRLSSADKLKRTRRARRSRQSQRTGIPLLEGKLKFVYRKNELITAQQEIHSLRVAECTELVQNLNQSIIRIDSITDDNYVTYTGLQHILQSNSIRRTRSSAAVHKRALLGFLAPAFQEIFGIASHANIAILQQNLQRLQDNQYYLSNSTTRVYEDLAILSNVTSRRIDLLWDELASQTSTMNDTIRHLNLLSKNFTKYLNDESEANKKSHTWASYSRSIHEHTNLLLLDCMMIQSKLNTWTRSLNRLINGYLPEEIIGAETLKTALAEARAHLQRTRPAFNVIHKQSNLAFYYSEKLAKVFIDYVTPQDINLFIHLKVPVSSLNKRLNVYQVLVNPVPLHSNHSVPQLGYMILENAPAYYMQSQDDKIYAELSLHDYQYCKALEQSSCSALTMNHDKTDQSCLASLFANDVAAIKTLCKFQYYPLAEPPSYTVFVADGVYLMATRGANIDIQCPSHVQQSQPAYYALIKIPCACSLAGEGIFIPPSLANCESEGTSFEISYPLNKIQAALFDFDMIDRPSDSAIPLFDTPPLLSFIQDFDTLRNADEVLQLDLNNRQVGFANNMRPLQNISPTKSSTWTSHFTSDIITYGISSVVIVTQCILVFFVARHHKAYLLWMTAASLPATRAYVLRKATTTPPPTPHTIVHSNPEALPWIQVFVAYILVASFCHLLLSLYRLYADNFRPPPGATTKVDLVFTNCKATKVIRIASIPICGRHIHAPNLPWPTEAEGTSGLFQHSTIILQWSHDLKIEALHMSQHYELPERVHLPLHLSNDIVTSRHTDILTTSEKPTAVIFVTIHCDCGCRTSKRGTIDIQHMNPDPTE